MQRAIVFDMYEHNSERAGYSLGNFNIDLTTNPFTIIKDIPEFKIGAAIDNKLPAPNPITGAKAWGSGDYNLVVIYKNTTRKRLLTKQFR